MPYLENRFDSGSQANHWNTISVSGVGVRAADLLKRCEWHARSNPVKDECFRPSGTIMARSADRQVCSANYVSKCVLERKSTEIPFAARGRKAPLANFCFTILVQMVLLSVHRDFLLVSISRMVSA